MLLKLSEHEYFFRQPY